MKNPCDANGPKYPVETLLVSANNLANMYTVKSRTIVLMNECVNVYDHVQ